MGKRSQDLAEKVWEEIRKKYVDNWEPSKGDIEWLIKTVSDMKIGGKWIIPAVGVTFEKVGEDHLRLESIVTNDMLSAMIAIEKTKKVGERAGIKVDIENAADYILFHP
ncbi:MAG: hypothetical protein QXG39_05910 [Candidatus Aenigmatarchaeota archaeon]